MERGRVYIHQNSIFCAGFWGPWDVVLTIVRTIHIVRNIKLGTISYTPYKKKDDFFVALNQVLNASDYYTKQVKKSDKKLDFRVYPVIVFDGEIYEFSIQDGELKIEPIEYLQYLSWGRAKMEINLVDVVRKDYFEEYLKIINQELEKLSTP